MPHDLLMKSRFSSSLKSPMSRFLKFPFVQMIYTFPDFSIPTTSMRVNGHWLGSNCSVAIFQTKTQKFMALFMALRLSNPTRWPWHNRQKLCVVWSEYNPVKCISHCRRTSKWQFAWEVCVFVPCACGATVPVFACGHQLSFFNFIVRIFLTSQVCTNTRNLLDDARTGDISKMNTNEISSSVVECTLCVW